MKKLIYTAIIIVIQHSIFNLQHSFAQAANDNIGSGNCLDFDGVNDFVEIGSTSDFDFGTGDFTISFWCTFEGAAEVRVAVARLNHCGAGDGFVVQCTNSGNISGVIGTGTVIGATSIQDGNWHHIAMVRSGGDMFIYVDGVQDGTRNDVAGQIATAHDNPNLHIGALNPASCISVTNYWPGYLDEIKIWNVAKTQTQIKNNMCEKLEGSETGLVAYWNMNEGTGNTVTDLTTNGNDGTLQ